ncbi:hypothetical protein GCM10022243_48610 [Saccharothrix violaceirubra]|uniref:Uncharacterized protein n=1 Tax=Saccharothrix violaceirubra TaxID=413306 RepID=A0A7W7WUH0_9PSEU|nr:hypothetical protein [Saccharothrix violaceirubra]MBB4963797.1 hypothetical protein [Saccharothrix violaceirubra]
MADDLTPEALAEWLADVPDLDLLATQGPWKWFPLRIAYEDGKCGFSGMRVWPGTAVVDVMATRGPDDATAHRRDGEHATWHHDGTLADAVAGLLALPEPQPEPDHDH